MLTSCSRDDLAMTDGTEEAQQFLQIELDTMKEINTKELGFEAGPINNNLFHWQAKLTGFGQESHVGSALYELALRHLNQSTGVIPSKVCISL